MQLPIIAADGAYNKLIKQDIIPDYIVGDFDSVTSEIHKDCQQIKITEQETTDFEKCINFAIKLELKPCIVYGASGLDLDHQMHNLNLIMRYKKLCPMLIKNRQQELIALPENFALKTKKDSIISLMPYPEGIISTEGLRWELINSKLSIYNMASIRNQANSELVKITCLGSVFLVCEHGIYSLV